MRVLFIYPTASWKNYNCGIAMLSAVLKKAGHETSLEFVHNWKRKTQNRIISKIRGFKPGLIAISCVTNQFERTKEIVAHLKNLDVPIVVGGVHATIAPEEVINLDGIIGLCKGEGEYALFELVETIENQKDYSKIKNWWIKKGGRIIKNPVRPLIKNLDKLPFADYNILDHQQFIDEFGNLQVFVNRGCPYQCNYCVNHTLMELYKGKGRFVRHRSVKSLMNELESLLSKYHGIKTIEFFDDTFILDKKWLAEFAEIYPKKIGVPFRCNARANLVDPETVNLLKKSGCYMVNMAIETGNEKLRMDVLNKKITNKQLIYSFGLLKEARIKIYSHNMVGLPYETINTIKETIELNKKINVDDLQCWVFYPYKGTKLYELCKEKRWLSDRKVSNITDLDIESVLDQTSISKKEVLYHHCTFKHEVFEPNSVKTLFWKSIAKNKGLISTYMVIRKCFKHLLPQKIIQSIQNVS